MLLNQYEVYKREKHKIMKKKGKQLLTNQKLLKNQALMIQNQLLQNIQKLHINYA